jgi:RNA polymerase sigma-70 factor, ECF subfamily
MDSEIESTLLQAALAGDSDAFSQLFEPYRHPLLLYGYRLLGSLEDAEDLVQEVSVRAWVKLATFERRASFRTWLYRITTHLGCDLIETRHRRSLPQYRSSPASPEGLAGLSDPIPVSSQDSRWLDPLPDTLLVDHTSEPETRYLQRESVTLAFLAILQELPARQRAILLLRDVLEFRAREVADLLDLSTAAVESALQRARAILSLLSQWCRDLISLEAFGGTPHHWIVGGEQCGGTSLHLWIDKELVKAFCACPLIHKHDLSSPFVSGWNIDQVAEIA